MSKKIIAANERQGCSTPSRLPKATLSVKKIRSKIHSELLVPIERTADKVFDLSVLLATIKEIAGGDANSEARLLKIRVLVDMGIGETDRIGESLCFAYLERGPAILAAVGGDQS